MSEFEPFVWVEIAGLLIILGIDQILKPVLFRFLGWNSRTADHIGDRRVLVSLVAIRYSQEYQEFLEQKNRVEERLHKHSP